MIVQVKRSRGIQQTNCSTCPRIKPSVYPLYAGDLGVWILLEENEMK